MDWSAEEVKQRQTIFSRTLVKQFMKKIRKYQNLMLKHGVNITDSGYGSDLHTSNSYDDDIELVLQENSTAIPSCKSFWTFGAQASFLRLFQWVYNIVQRTKAAQILHHLDTVPENEIESTIVEVAKELCVAFEYQLMMLYSNTEVIKLADHGVVCLMTYLNSYDSEFTCASLLQAVLEVKPLTGNKKEIVKTRVITHNGKCYCLCWKLWQVLKQAGLRVPITSLNQDPQNEDIAKLSLDNDSEEVILAEIHLSLNNAHMVIEEVSDSSELEVQVESDPQMPPVDDKLNVSEELGETIQTVESELGLRNEDVTEHESYGKEVDNDKDTPECKLTDDMKVTNFDKTKIDTLQETCNTKWVTFDGKTEDVKSSTTDDFGVVLTANINKSVSITESKNFEGVAEDKENIKHLDNPPETAEIVRAVDEEMLDTHYDYKSQPESFDADKIEENSVKHSNCLDEGIHYYSAQNSSLPVDINDVDSSAHALVTDPFIDINSVQEIDCEQSEFECDTNAIPEQNMDRDRLNESKQDASPHCLSKDNVTFYHIENCTENTALDSVESLTLGELVSDENDKANVYGQIVDGNSVSHSLHILCDKNGTTLSNSTLPSTRTDQSTSAITDESNHPSSNGSIIASTSSNADESNLLRTIEMTNENNFSSMNAMAEGNGIGSSSTINNENNIQNTNTVHLLDKNLLSAITDESNLPRKSATTEECSVPNASAIADESNLGSASAITAKCYLSTSESVSAITDESHLPNASAVTEENNLSANTNIMKNFPNDTAIIDGNSSYASAIIEQRSSVSVTNQAAENGFRYVGSQIYIARTKEESESKIEEEIVFKPQLKQETGAVSEHIEDEYLYKFYGCFTPYGAKCRPKVYGFRGPLHAWNETEGQFDLVFNDKVTVIDSRARHIPFTEGDKHMVYIPKTYCKH